MILNWAHPEIASLKKKYANSSFAPLRELFFFCFKKPDRYGTKRLMA